MHNRGIRPIRYALQIIIAVIVVAAVIFATVYVSQNYLVSQSNSVRNQCAQPGIRHVVTIKNAFVSPEHINAKRCDSLVITNEDDTDRLIAFGDHDNHIAYDSIAEEELTKGHSLTVQLIRVGIYHFHDHYHDNVVGTFTVSR